MTVTYEWRGDFGNAELNALHAEAFEHRLLQDDWKRQLSDHSLGWVCARDAGGLVGFLNVPWDGSIHAFVLDTMVAKRSRSQGIGALRVAMAVEQSRKAGCEWLHVDFGRRASRLLLRPLRVHADQCGNHRAVTGGVNVLAG